MNKNKFAEIKTFLGAHFEPGIGAFIIKHIPREIFANSTHFLIKDLSHLGRIKNTNPHQLVVSAPLINDFADINLNLMRIRNSLWSNGIFIGRAETLGNRSRLLYYNFSAFVCKLIVLYEFIFKRVFPKLAVLRTLYTKLRIIKHHILSKCEVLGRLHYCGFKVAECIETDRYLYFVAHKKSPRMNKKPQDGILIKIAKAGRGGKEIYCYKLRTMHAYAEYIHEYILNNCKIDNEGKVVNDFRKTSWGRFLRKIWLDEMPQLFNILKGDLSLIGLRPLSKQFLKLYPEDWRKKRMSIKSGFIPPYYADCPKTFQEIIESEKRYYELKKRHPVTTDVFYLVKVMVSFICGHARTG